DSIGGPGTWSYAHPDAVTDEISANVPGYERFRSDFGMWGKARAADTPTRFDTQPVSAPAADSSSSGDLLLTTGRTLYTSLEGAALHLPDADKLHREEFVEVHPADVSALRLRDEEEVTLVT